MYTKAIRLRRAKGKWMKLTSATLLAGYMERHDFSQARLGRYAGCSRQFIHQLLNGESTTCTPELAAYIEEALGVIPGTLFVDPKSTLTRPSVASRSTAPVGRPVTKKRPAAA